MAQIKLVVKGAPAQLTTYGSLWRSPREPGDSPVQNLVIVRRVPTTLNLPPGGYQYYFAFTGQEDDDAFTLSMRHVATPAPDPTETNFNTTPTAGRVFRFRV